MASIAAFQPVLAGHRCDCEAYVLSLSESLAEELRGSGVSVTVLCPGITTRRYRQRGRGERGARPAAGLLIGDR
ncbi:MAG: hypothetical protein IPJ27_15290 [Candidatus Accumulibacter sp.]|uniref:Uncharacterized protein n=1 Tax=Candidatus Accumulibacter proximus TaxID=2954385 RepID=A0A935UGT3_9PROT|nr:hypothetical protein [Candidatus Accumulibacter proximus]